MIELPIQSLDPKCERAGLPEFWNSLVVSGVLAPVGR
jgi:hypothetical protein